MLRSINFSLIPLIVNIPHMSIRLVPEADVLTLYCVNLGGAGQYVDPPLNADLSGRHHMPLTLSLYNAERAAPQILRRK